MDKAGLMLPPLGVARLRGVGAQFWLNVLLTVAGFLPGLAHRLWLGRGRKREG
ncbi:MAG: YqaE/Pmp3 family membrane protein [Spirochaetaceae bacterium]|nr:YqaE/Pmp3 family membrane protein [Spirochaetaceae bacterium]HPG26785.1 YqaE/Pmp3 family membrane protein [Myxococcota bacterium]